MKRSNCFIYLFIYFLENFLIISKAVRQKKSDGPIDKLLFEEREQKKSSRILSRTNFYLQWAADEKTTPQKRDT